MCHCLECQKRTGSVFGTQARLPREFVTIEEYLGENTTAYYAALNAVQEGAYRPEQDATPFVRLCVEAHIAQARRRLHQLAEAGARWTFLEMRLTSRGNVRTPPYSIGRPSRSRLATRFRLS